MFLKKLVRNGFRAAAALLLTASGFVHAQVSISQLPPATLPLKTTDAMIVNQTISGVKATRQAQLSALAPFFPSLTSHYILQAPDATLTQSRTLAGTANQVILTDGGALGNMTLSLPQSIAPTNTPTFAGLTLTGALNGTSGAFSGALSALSLSLTNPLPATSGGTGFASYTIGDVLSADSGTTLSRIVDVSAGSYFRSGGAGTLPLWSTVKIPNTAILGDIWYGSAGNVISALAGNITTTKQFLTQTGSGAVSAAPAWGTIAAGDLPGSFSGFANPTASVGLAAVNGAATTAMRSDAAPALSQAIAPTWSANHTWSQSSSATITPVTLTNPNGGTATAIAESLSNGTRSMQLAYTGTAFSTAFLTNGPTGEGGSLTTSGAFPLTLGTNSAARLSITSAGDMGYGVANVNTVSLGASIPTFQLNGGSTARSGGIRMRSSDASADAAMFVDTASGGLNWGTVTATGIVFLASNANHGSISSGGAWTIPAPTAGQALAITAIANQDALSVTAPNTAGQSFGQIITAGTNTSDEGLRVRNAAGTTQFLVRGDGNVSVPNGPANVSAFSVTGNSTSGQSFGITSGAGTTSADYSFTANTFAGSAIITARGDRSVIFPGVGTTASAANAFLDNAASNNLLRSTSSLRYKTDISTMSDAAAGLIYKLRPVRFHSLASADDPRRWFYGLVAEEVAKVEPSLVNYDAQGRPDGVQYDRVQVFMLPEVQSMHRQIRWLWGCLALLVIWNSYLTIKCRSR